MVARRRAGRPAGQEVVVRVLGLGGPGDARPAGSIEGSPARTGCASFAGWSRDADVRSGRSGIGACGDRCPGDRVCSQPLGWCQQLGGRPDPAGVGPPGDSKRRAGCGCDGHRSSDPVAFFEPAAVAGYGPAGGGPGAAETTAQWERRLGAPWAMSLSFLRGTKPSLNSEIGTSSSRIAPWMSKQPHICKQPRPCCGLLLGTSPLRRTVRISFARSRPCARASRVTTTGQRAGGKCPLRPSLTLYVPATGAFPAPTTTWMCLRTQALSMSFGSHCSDEA